MSKLDFSLTHPEPRIARQPNDGRNWDMEAHDRLLDVEHAHLDFGEALTVSAEVSERLLKGDYWFKIHGDTHPKSKQARIVHNRLIDQQQHHLHVVKLRFVKLWLCVCALHGTLNQMSDPDVWIAKHAPHIPANDVRSIWNTYEPDRSPPFTTWPCDEAYYIENRPFTYESLLRWMHRDEATP